MPNRLSFAGTPRPFAAFLALCAGLLAALPVRAQQPLLDSTYPAPRFVSILPAGGKAGTVVEATVAGVDFDEPEKLLFSSPGFKAELVPPPPPDPKVKAPPRPARQPNVPETAVFKITVPPDAPLGITDVRFVGKWGVSNPLRLHGRRPARGHGKGAEQRCAAGPARRDEHHRQRHDRQRRRCGLLRLRRQKRAARPRQLPGLHHRQPPFAGRAGVRRQESHGRVRPQLQRQRRPRRLRPARRRRLLRPGLRVHEHGQHPRRPLRILLPTHGLHQSVDRRHFPGRRRAGQADAGDDLRPQPAGRPARPVRRAGRPRAGQAHGHRHRPDRPRRPESVELRRPPAAQRLRAGRLRVPRPRPPPARPTPSC